MNEMLATTPQTDALHPYACLTPDAVLDALASIGLMGDGRLMALSSYENRVYQIQLETGRGPVQTNTSPVPEPNLDIEQYNNELKKSKNEVVHLHSQLANEIQKLKENMEEKKQFEIAITEYMNKQSKEKEKKNEYCRDICNLI